MMRTTLAGALPFAFLATIAVSGADFGRYWDDEAMFMKVRRSLAPPVTLLPHAYDYPGVTFLMALSAVAPEAVRDPGLRHAVPDTSALEVFTHTDAYRLRTRRLFAVVSSLTAVWVAGLCLAIDGTPWEALLAAALFAGSWEVGYHARWIAPDGVTMMFVAASVMCLAFALRSEAHRSRWIHAAALLAGLATASKYSAWPLVPIVMTVAWVSQEHGSDKRERFRELATAGATSVAVFFLASPGTLLQPTLSFGQIRAQIFHYGSGHGIYTVGRGADHLRRMLAYDALVMPSPFLVVSVVLTAAALVGAVALAKQSPRLTFAVLAFPAFFTLYFAAQRVMIVRNLLVVAPFGSVLAARGVRAAWQASSGRRAIIARTAIGCAAAVALAANLLYQVRAVQHITASAARGSEYALDEFRAWLRGQPDGSVQTLGRLAHDVSAKDTGGAASVALYALDAVHAGVQPNEPRTFTHVFGLQEVNLDYYPDWIGADHIVVLSRAAATRAGVLN
jgi:hypothetical protein